MEKILKANISSFFRHELPTVNSLSTTPSMELHKVVNKQNRVV